MFFAGGESEELNKSLGDALAVELKAGEAQATLKNAQEALSVFSAEILKTFSQGRERVFELQKTLVDALPAVRRLGGDLTNVSQTISGIATASRRNVVATTEQIEKFVALEKILGKTALELSDSFLNVGVGIESIPKALEESIQYVQSIGGNSKQVFEDVSKNMEKMNRFQFEDGVLGLTKMAAQASMMRFDVGETLKLADDVLNPDRAIEVAAAFQRLGVAAGTLVDPFALMNASINDPSGLQDSLIDVAKQFTYFDEKTRTFKINPQGVLTLKEMQLQTGVSAAEMTKLGLAAAELDERLSQISPSIEFKNEEDKQYLANIGTMTKGGDYVVKLKGSDEEIKLSEITQTQFDKLIDEQKEGSKSIEETAREQLSNSKSIDGNVKAIRSAIMGTILTTEGSMDIVEGIREGYEAFYGVGGRQLDTKELREAADDASQELLKKLTEEIKGGNVSPEKILATLTEGAIDIFGAVGKESIDTIGEASGKISKELEKEKNTETAKAMSAAVQPILETMSMALTTQNYVPTMYDPRVDPSILNPPSPPMTSVSVGGTEPITPTRGVSLPLTSRDPIKVEFGPVPDINLNFNNGPQNMTPQQIEEITKIFERLIQRQDIKNYLVNNTNEPRAYQAGTGLGI